MAKILLLDIETAPHLAMCWGLFNENIPLDRIEQPGYTLCWAAKWAGSKRIMSAKNDDAHCFTAIHELLSQADAVVSYNGKRFDVPTLNKEFVLRGMDPPAPFLHLDMYYAVRSNFRFASNKLDFVSQQLGLGAKVKHRGFALWRGCMNGDKASWKEMVTYNKGDVTLLESLFNKLKPWLPNTYGFKTAAKKLGGF